MHKSIPISLGVIAVSLATLAGVMVYNLIKVNAIQREIAERFEEAAKRDALARSRQAYDRCNKQITVLTDTETRLRQEAKKYAPNVSIKDPESLNDVQSILHRNLVTEANQMAKDIAELRSQCPITVIAATADTP